MRFEHQRTISLYCATVDVLSSSPMSYHRVLPPPPALANRNRARSWVLEPEALLQPRTMTIEKTDDDGGEGKSPALSEKCSSPAAERVSPSVESLEDYEDPPRARTRSSSQASNAENLQLRRRLPSISKASPMSWQGESPSQICLCQPDPKVPRPRNGTQVIFIHSHDLPDSCVVKFLLSSLIFGSFTCISFHSLPPTSSSHRSLTESRSCKSGNLKSDWGPLEIITT